VHVYEDTATSDDVKICVSQCRMIISYCQAVGLDHIALSFG
jgi:hypothetical protein